MPLNGETISFAGILGKRVTTGSTKTVDSECGSKRNVKGREDKERERERENVRKGTTRMGRGDEVTPENNGETQWKGRRAREVGRRRDRNGGGWHSIQFPKKLFSI